MSQRFNSGSHDDFNIELSENGEYTAPGMQLALMQQIPPESNAQIQVKSLQELERQFAGLVQDSHNQLIVVALNTPSLADEHRAHWSLIIIDKGRVCYCNTLTSDFQVNEGVVRGLARNLPFQSFDIEALNSHRDIADIDDMNLGVCGYWVESMAAIAVRHLDKLMQGSPGPLLQGLREKINNNFAGFVHNGFERWTSRHNQIRHSELQGIVAARAENQAGSLDRKRKAALQLQIAAANNLSEAIQQLHPDSEISTRYAAMNSIFNAAIAKEKIAEKQYQAVAQHWKQVGALMVAAHTALMLSKNLGLPSSFSKEFAKHKSDSRIKDAIAFVEAQAMASFIAFQNPPVNGRAEFLNKVIADLIAATQHATGMVHSAKHNLAMQSVSKRLQGKPQYQEIFMQVRALSANVENVENVNIHDAIDKLLLSLYLQAYKVSREKKLLGSSVIRDDITPWLDTILLERCHEIEAMVPCKGIENTQVNRILHYAGKKYEEFVAEVKAELSAFQSGDRKLFVNTGKLLGRLGQAGFQASAMLFARKDQQYVDESDIGKYYDKKVVNQTKIKLGK
jgi:hypothetical protein